MLRSMGVAWRGAVCVTGGAEKVRAPRLPKLLPPPMRASTSPASSTIAARTAIIATGPRTRFKFMKILPAQSPLYIRDSPQP